MKDKMHNIAIVEDEPQLQELYEEMLKANGFNISYVAGDGEEALSKLQNASEKPDIIIMDYKLPVLDGIEATKKILQESPDTRIIFVTAYDNVEAEAKTAGAVQFIKKPVTSKELVKSIGETLKDNFEDFKTFKETKVRSRGRPTVHEEDKKNRVTFSIANKLIDQFNEICDSTGEDPNRLLEKVLTTYIETQGSVEVKKQILEDINDKIQNLVLKREAIKDDLRKQEQSLNEINDKRQNPDYQAKMRGIWAKLYEKYDQVTLKNVLSGKDESLDKLIDSYASDQSRKFKVPKQYVKKDLENEIEACCAKFMD